MEYGATAYNQPVEFKRKQNINEDMELNICLFKDKIKSLVIDIANKNYSKIEFEKVNGRVNIMDLERVIDEYNETIIPLPEPFKIDSNSIYHIKRENSLLVLIDLWTKEEGRSDLTLSVLCFLRNNEPIIKINDLRVL